MIHTYLGETISFEIKYKNSTSIGITIDSDGNVEVQAPKGTPDEKVLQLIEGKWDLNQEKLTEMKDRLLGPQKKVYEYGESFLYLGKTYPIQIFQDINITQEHVVFKEEKLHIYVKQSKCAIWFI